MSDVDHDVVVLAGGAGSRLGGVDKSALVVGGRSLLQRALAAAGAARHVVVVGPVAVPQGALQTVEDPPGSGPVAGIAAGMAALRARRGTAAPWVLVLAVDQPGAEDVVPALLAAARAHDDDPGEGRGPVDAVCHRDAGGHRQWLLAAYRGAALESALGRLDEVRDRAVKHLVRDLRFAETDAAAEHVGDVDTPEDLRRWRERLGG